MLQYQEYTFNSEVSLFNTRWRSFSQYRMFYEFTRLYRERALGCAQSKHVVSECRVNRNATKLYRQYSAGERQPRWGSHRFAFHYFILYENRDVQNYNLQTVILFKHAIYNTITTNITMASKECWCVLYLCILHSAFSFNLEPRIPVIKYGEKGSYFGFSVAEHLTINSTSGDKTSW